MSSGPLLTTIATDESRDTLVPADGLVPITLPASTVLLNASSARVGLNRADVTTCAASSYVRPATSGTCTGAGPSLTTSVTIDSRRHRAADGRVGRDHRSGRHGLVVHRCLLDDESRSLERRSRVGRRQVRDLEHLHARRPTRHDELHGAPVVHELTGARHLADHDVGRVVRGPSDHADPEPGVGQARAWPGRT